MNDYQMWLSDWFKTRNPLVTLSTGDNVFDSGAIDSLGVIELIEDMEQAFCVRFSQQDFQDERFICIAGLAEMLTEKLLK